MNRASGWRDSALADVRPYTVTGGRTRTRHRLTLTTCLITRPAATGSPGPDGEALLLHCSGRPLSVAELAARTAQPVQVIKVLVGDLLDCQALALANPYSTPAAPDVPILERLLDGLRRL